MPDTTAGTSRTSAMPKAKCAKSKATASVATPQKTHLFFPGSDDIAWYLQCFATVILPTCDFKPSDPREAEERFSFFILFFAKYFDHIE